MHRLPNWLAAGLFSWAAAPIPANGLEPPPDWLWALHTLSASEGRDVTTDRAGNVYVTGTFLGTASFGASNVTAHGAADLFIAKYQSTGSLDWVRHFGGGDEDAAQGFGIALDATDHLYVTGKFAGALNLGTTNLSSGGSTDYSAFVVKCDLNGQVLWTAHGDNPDAANPNPLTWGNSVAVDAQGHVYVAGRFASQITFGGAILSESGYGDAFLVKFDSTGKLLRLDQIGGDNWDQIYDLTLDADGNTILAGFFAGEAYFGLDAEGSATYLISSGAADLFVAKYDAEGRVRWLRQAGAPDGSDEDSPLDAARAVAVDAAGGIYVTGWFAGPEASFGTTNLTTDADSDLFVAKYDGAGELVWARRGPPPAGRGYGIAVDPEGNAWVAGVASTVFIAQFDGSGNLRWQQTTTGDDATSVYGLALDPVGGALVTGWYRDSIRFGDTLLEFSDRRAMFVAKLGGIAPPSLSIARAGGDLILSWPLASTGFELEATSDLSWPAWHPVDAVVSTNGTRHTATVMNAHEQQFYRLGPAQE